MPTTLERGLRDLEAECVALCEQHEWTTEAGAPDYRLVLSRRSTFRHRADLMLLGVHPRGDASLADGDPPKSAHRRRDDVPLLDDAWAGREPGAAQLQAVARDVARLFGDPESVLRDVPAGNMIPFRSESISRLPDSLRKQGLSIGARLVGLVRPQVLVLIGGDRVLFRMAVSELPGRLVDSAEQTFGATHRAYRDVLVADAEGGTFAAVIPQHAIEDGLRLLRERLDVLGRPLPRTT